MLIRRLILPVVFVAALFVLTGCGDNSGSDQPDAAAPSAGAVVGQIVPDFKLQRLDGSTLQLSNLRGKAVMIDFWDTWCPPCIAAMPHLQQISETYADDLVVVGAAFGRQGPEAVAKFIADKGLTFEFVLADQKVVEDFGGLTSIPTTFLVDAEGRVTHKWIGGQTESVYEDAVRTVTGS